MYLKFYIEFWDNWSIKDNPKKIGRIGWDDKAKKFVVIGKDDETKRKVQFLYKEVLEGRKSKEELKKAKNKPFKYLDIISEFYSHGTAYTVSDVKYGDNEL